MQESKNKKWYSEQDIDKLVKERTSEIEASLGELQDKVKNLEDMRRAMLNMLEDVDQSKSELLISEKSLKNAVESLKEMDVKKDEFISIAAHELKTPVTSIRGFVQLLLSTCPANASDESKRYLDIINKDTDRLNKLITDVLDLSRIDLNALKLDPTEENIPTVVKELIHNLSPLIKARSLRIKLTIGRNVRTARLDRLRFEQVLTNLMTNAIKYSPKGGIILVSAKKEKRHLVFSVKDSGPGVQKKFQDKIFERFYQVDSSQTRKVGGTGLGLAVCHELVGLMGGKIWLKSVPKKGSTFYFTLPLSH